MYSPYFKKLFAATLQTLPIPVHAAQTETHTHTHACTWRTFPHSCMPASPHTCLPDCRGHSLPSSLCAMPTSICQQSSSLKPRPRSSDWRFIHTRLWPCRYIHALTKPNSTFSTLIGLFSSPVTRPPRFHVSLPNSALIPVSTPSALWCSVSAW